MCPISPELHGSSASPFPDDVAPTRIGTVTECHVAFASMPIWFDGVWCRVGPRRKR